MQRLFWETMPAILKILANRFTTQKAISPLGPAAGWKGMQMGSKGAASTPRCIGKRISNRKPRVPRRPRLAKRFAKS